jgi:hypothetical protein
MSGPAGTPANPEPGSATARYAWAQVGAIPVRDRVEIKTKR